MLEGCDDLNFSCVAWNSAVLSGAKYNITFEMLMGNFLLNVEMKKESYIMVCNEIKM